MAAQLWVTPKFAALGAPAGSGVGVCYPQPFDTWAEMDHLLRRERWPSRHTPGSIVYLCSAMDEPYGYQPPPADDCDHRRRQRTQVRRSLLHWLNKCGGTVFRGLTTRDGGFDYGALVAPEGLLGEQRIDAQYIAATQNVSDRYVLSLPGSNRYRVRPHETGFSNLVFTGDWTLNAISAGCVEAAVMSGREAAYALVGGNVDIPGDWLTRVHRELKAVPTLQVAAGAAQSRGELAQPPPSKLVRREDPDGRDPIPDLPAPSPLPSEMRTLKPRAEYPYRSRPLDLIPRPNYICNRTQTDWFFFEADDAKLAALCDRLLNHEHSPTYYRPAVPVVAFVAARLDETYADTERIAYIPEKDYALWIPIEAEAKPGREDEHRASPFSWLQPCLWVDSCPAVVGGREVYGVNKVLAKLTDPSDGNGRYRVETIAIKKQGLPRRQEPPTELAEFARIIELKLDGGSNALNDDLKSDALNFEALKIEAVGFDQLIASDFFVDAKSGLKDAGSPIRWLKTLFDQLREQTVHLVALKVFPDVADADLVCYRAIVEAPTRPTTPVKLKRIKGRHALRLYRFESHPIAELYGLTTNPGQDDDGVDVDVAVPFFAMSASFDFVLEKGRVIFDFLRQGSPVAAEAKPSEEESA